MSSNIKEPTSPPFKTPQSTPKYSPLPYPLSNLESEMSRGPSFKAGDRVVFRSNPYNREAVARGQVKRVVVEESSADAPNSTASNTKYVVKNTSTGKESVLSAQEIVSRQ